MSTSPLISHQTCPRWFWVHQLSLEAPIVAMAWCAGLSRLHDTPLMPGVLLGLGLCAWIFYMLDRCIDCFVSSSPTSVAPRAFSKPQKVVLLSLIVLALGIMGWLALWQIPMGLMWECASLGLLLLLYLAVIHSGGQHWLCSLWVPGAGLLVLVATDHWPLSPDFQLVAMLLVLVLLIGNFFSHLRQQMSSTAVKDVMGGVLFALGCTAWTRFTQGGADVMTATLELWLLSCLFVVNLSGLSTPKIQGRWLYLGLGSVAGVLVLAWLDKMPDDLGYVAESCALGLILMLGLKQKQRVFSPDAYRICIDLAALLPVGYLWMRM